ncbi:MAG: dTDP-4-amino-4,6-dideoxygalactose transaminase, partial [Bacteroidota bacterium]
GMEDTFLTSSGTGALEIISILLDIKPGDEVILPSFTYPSTANPFVLRGAKLVFADSMKDHPNMDVEKLPELITPATKAIIVMHYGGISCDMDTVTGLAKKHGIIVVEDAALGMDSFYKGKALGSMGDFGVYSFHDTKHISAGEGGLLIINNKDYIARAGQVYETGTNRSDFLAGKVDRYEWTDTGMSCKMSELNAAVLYARLEQKDIITGKLKNNWELYYQNLTSLQDSGYLQLPIIPPHVSSYNYQTLYIVLDDISRRDGLRDFLYGKGIQSGFHYQALHDSRYARKKYDNQLITYASAFSGNLLRLPIYPGLTEQECMTVIQAITSYF